MALNNNQKRCVFIQKIFFLAFDMMRSKNASNIYIIQCNSKKKKKRGSVKKRGSIYGICRVYSVGLIIQLVGFIFNHFRHHSSSSLSQMLHSYFVFRSKNNFKTLTLTQTEREKKLNEFLFSLL